MSKRLAIFLLVFFLTYGATHYYLFWKVHRAFPRMGWRNVPVAAFLAFMVTAPILARLLDRAGQVGAGRALGFVAYCWMAPVFWFLCLAALTDVWGLGVRVAALWKPAARQLIPAPRAALAVQGAIILAAVLWGVVEARSIRLVEITVHTPHLPPGSEPVRIVQIGDLHFGPTVGSGHLRKVAAVVKQARPDLLVSTGDLLDISFHNPDDDTAILASIDAPLGKFAVLGNHEFYAGLDSSIAFHEAAGLRLLRQEAVLAGGRVLVAGMDDPGDPHPRAKGAVNEGAILPPAHDRPPTILLKHRPQVDPASPGRFDVQLSGHTHGGQIFPFSLLVGLSFTYVTGLHSVGEGSFIYVTRGTGTWGPPMRLFARPEVTLIKLQPDQP